MTEFEKEKPEVKVEHHYYHTAPTTAPVKKGLAITSLVLSLVGIVILPTLLGLLAVIFGAIDFKKSKMAKAGLIIGIIDIAFGIYNWIQLADALNSFNF